MRVSSFFNFKQVDRTHEHAQAKQLAESLLSQLSSVRDGSKLKNVSNFLFPAHIYAMKEQLFLSQHHYICEFEAMPVYDGELLRRIKESHKLIVGEVYKSESARMSVIESLEELKELCHTFSSFCLAIKKYKSRRSSQEELQSLSNGLLRASQHLEKIIWNLDTRVPVDSKVCRYLLEACAILSWDPCGATSRFEQTLVTKFVGLENVLKAYKFCSNTSQIREGLLPIIRHILDTEVSSFSTPDFISEECRSLIRERW